MRKARARAAAVCALGCLSLWACQPSKVVTRAGAVDAVVARVDGEPVYRSDLAHDGIDAAIDRKLLAREAIKGHLDRTASGRRRLDAAREQVLGNLVLEDRLRGAVTPEVVDGLYAEMEKARPAGSPPETLDQARPRIVRFLTYDRIKDLVLDLRHRAKIEVVSQAGAKP